LYYTASGIVTPVGGRPVHRLGEDVTSRSRQVAVTVSAMPDTVDTVI